MIRVDEQPCVVCAGCRSTLLWTTRWPQHAHAVAFSMRQCQSCGLLFNSPRLEDTRLARLYEGSYYFFNRSDRDELTRIADMYQRTIALVEHAVSRKRCLDVGCGRGYLPVVLRGMTWDAHGLEISPEAADYARQQFGVNVFTGTIEEYVSHSTRQFPLLTAIDVIEHVPRPDAFAAALASAVEPGGYVIVDTPNAASYNAAAEGTEWMGFNPFHIYLFTIDNLSRLLEACGLRIERAFSYNNMPVDRRPRLLRRRVVRAGVMRGLRKVGLLGAFSRAHAAMRSRPTGARAASPDEVRQTVARIRSDLAWDASDDMTAPLAESARGDNIVVIARKPSGM